MIIDFFKYRKNPPPTTLVMADYNDYDYTKFAGVSSSLILKTGVQKTIVESEPTISIPNINHIHFLYANLIIKHTYDSKSRLYHLTKNEYKFLKSIFHVLDVNRIKDDMIMQAAYFSFKTHTSIKYYDEIKLGIIHNIKFIEKSQVPPIVMEYNSEINEWSIS